MLKECPAQQHQGELKKRWFTNNYFDLIVWQNNLSEITRFQLCYDKNRNERALTWTMGRGFDHNSIDDGESSPLKNKSPILLEDGLFPGGEVLKTFVADSTGIEQQIRSFIIEKLSNYQHTAS